MHVGSQETGQVGSGRLAVVRRQEEEYQDGQQQIWVLDGRLALSAELRRSGRRAGTLMPAMEILRMLTRGARSRPSPMCIG